MGSYILVRESREGRQSPEDTVHCLEKDAGETECGEFDKREVRTVRTLSAFTNSSPVCSECGEVLKDVH